GSGSTLLAAERTGRSCYGLEIDPGYVDVAVRRWQTLTGRDAVHGVSGLTFEEVGDQRAAQLPVQRKTERGSWDANRSRRTPAATTPGRRNLADPVPPAMIAAPFRRSRQMPIHREIRDRWRSAM